MELKKLNADDLRKMKVANFAERDTLEEVVEYAQSFGTGVTIPLFVYHNTLLEILAKVAERIETENIKLK